MSKMRVGSKAFMKEAIEMANCLVDIRACNDCGHPVVYGYCCSHCGSESPTTRDSERVELK